MADDAIILPVPESVEAIYLVPLTEPIGDPVRLLRGLLPGRWQDPGFGTMLQEALADSMPAEVVTVDQVSTLPLSLFEAFGATPAQVARAGAATHLFLSRGRGQPGWPSIQEFVTRALAIMIAEHAGSEVIDVLDIRIRGTVKARQALPDGAGLTTLAESVSVAYSPDSVGYWVTTTGLQRFGLPELQTLAVPPNVVELWGRALTGLALRLATIWNDILAANPGQAFVALPEQVTFSAADVADAYRQDRSPGDDEETAAVRLTLDPGSTVQASHGFLTVNPPLSWRGSAGEYLTYICSTFFEPPRDEVRHVHPGPELDEAIAVARAGLPGIRQRFESGTMDPHTKLLVKYRLVADEGRENLWAYVTSWRDPDKLLATSANDAVYFPRVRRGKPVVVEEATIIDWVVAHDEQGTIEGGFTAAALGS